MHDRSLQPGQLGTEFIPVCTRLETRNTVLFEQAPCQPRQDQCAPCNILLFHTLAFPCTIRHAPVLAAGLGWRSFAPTGAAPTGAKHPTGASLTQLPHALPDKHLHPPLGCGSGWNATGLPSGSLVQSQVPADESRQRGTCMQRMRQVRPRGERSRPGKLALAACRKRRASRWCASGWSGPPLPLWRCPYGAIKGEIPASISRTPADTLAVVDHGSSQQGHARAAVAPAGRTASREGGTQLAWVRRFGPGRLPPLAVRPIALQRGKSPCPVLRRWQSGQVLQSPGRQRPDWRRRRT